MENGKNIQIIKQTSKDIKLTNDTNTIEISHKGKPISGQPDSFLELKFQCSSSHKPFHVVVAEHEHQYKVIDVVKNNESLGSNQAANQNQDKLYINIQNIEERHKIHCPYCQNGDIIQCGCGGLSCGGGIIKEGTQCYHKCPWCMRLGVIQGRIEKLSGDRLAPFVSNKGTTAKRNTLQNIFHIDPNIKQLR